MMGNARQRCQAGCVLRHRQRAPAYIGATNLPTVSPSFMVALAVTVAPGGTPRHCHAASRPYPRSLPQGEGEEFAPLVTPMI